MRLFKNGYECCDKMISSEKWMWLAKFFVSGVVTPTAATKAVQQFLTMCRLRNVTYMQISWEGNAPKGEFLYSKCKKEWGGGFRGLHPLTLAVLIPIDLDTLQTPSQTHPQ